jgi:hypothetical protein
VWRGKSVRVWSFCRVREESEREIERGGRSGGANRKGLVTRIRRRSQQEKKKEDPRERFRK